MKFKSEKCPDTFLPEDRLCRACGNHTNLVLTAIGKFHSFPSCTTFECQEVVKSRILASIAADRKPFATRVLRHVLS